MRSGRAVRFPPSRKSTSLLMLMTCVCCCAGACQHSEGDSQRNNVSFCQERQREGGREPHTHIHTHIHTHTHTHTHTHAQRTSTHTHTHAQAHTSTRRIKGTNMWRCRPPLYSSLGLRLEVATNTTPRSNKSVNSRFKIMASATSVTCKQTKDERHKKKCDSEQAEAKWIVWGWWP